MKKILIILLFVPLLGSAQTQLSDRNSFDKKNSVNIELLGHGILYSIYYERIIVNGNRFKTTGQVGFGGVPGWGYTIPFLINEVFTVDRSHHLEIGFGIQYFNLSDIRTTLRIGYRFQKPDGKLVIRAGYTPNIDFFPYFFHWGGLSIGHTF